jgi:hypothetical protein
MWAAKSRNKHFKTRIRNIHTAYNPNSSLAKQLTNTTTENKTHREMPNKG